MDFKLVILQIHSINFKSKLRYLMVLGKLDTYMEKNETTVMGTLGVFM